MIKGTVPGTNTPTVTKKKKALTRVPVRIDVGKNGNWHPGTISHPDVVHEYSNILLNGTSSCRSTIADYIANNENGLVNLSIFFPNLSSDDDIEIVWESNKQTGLVAISSVWIDLDFDLDGSGGGDSTNNTQRDGEGSAKKRRRTSRRRNSLSVHSAIARTPPTAAAAARRQVATEPRRRLDKTTTTATPPLSTRKRKYIINVADGSNDRKGKIKAKKSKAHPRKSSNTRKAAAAAAATNNNNVPKRLLSHCGESNYWSPSGSKRKRAM